MCRDRPAGLDCRFRHQSRTRTLKMRPPDRFPPLPQPPGPLRRPARSKAHYLDPSYPQLLSCLRGGDPLATFLAFFCFPRNFLSVAPFS